MSELPTLSPGKWLWSECRAQAPCMGTPVGASLKSSGIISLSLRWSFSSGVLIKCLTTNFFRGGERKQSLICSRAALHYSSFAWCKYFHVKPCSSLGEAGGEGLFLAPNNTLHCSLVSWDCGVRQQQPNSKAVARIL